MFGRRLFHFLFTLLILAGYILVYVFMMPLDAMQYISLLFTTIALTLVYAVPIVYPKKGKGHAKMTFRLYGVTILYAIPVLVCSYLFSFKYTLDANAKVFGMPLDERFYFLMNTIVLGIFLFIILLCMGTPKQKESFYDDDEEPKPAPVQEKKLPDTEPVFKFLNEEEPQNETPHNPDL
ncbi:MAG: hypothetical protein IIZ48_02785 [Erysipelotrichales bacterium]|nr:hypothetical protein [Erysipelotrichales bacterium]